MIEQLSQIDYFCLPEITQEIKETIHKIDPVEYEVFVLDIYNETIKAGNKRSKWFISDQAAGLQVFIWLMNYLKTPNQYAILTKFAEKCFTKIPRVGPTSRIVGDTVLKILDQSETMEGLGVLLTLKSRNKYPVFLEALSTSIKKAIYFTNLNPNEIEDYFVNDYDLKEGQISQYFDGFSSTIEVLDFNQVSLTWFKKDGSIQKSVPAKVKNNFSSALKTWKAKQKDLKKELFRTKTKI